jgi:hypothetical protein
VDKEQAKQAADTTEDVTILAPDYALKKAIGEKVDLKKLFSEDKIALAQKKIDEEQEKFLEWVLEDVQALEHSYRELSKDIAHAQPHLAQLRRAAFAIKGQAGIFSYDLASQVARSLYMFCDTFKYREEQRIVLRKHIDALAIIFRDRIAGSGGEIGQELLREIERLSAKFSS